MMTKLTEIEIVEKKLNKRIDEIEALQKDNSIAIAELTSHMNELTIAVTNLTESTQGLVDVWMAGKTLQKAVKWLSGFAFIGVVIAWWIGES